MVFIALYLLLGDRADVMANNSRRLDSLAAYFKALSIPCFIFGDWNATPVDVASWPVIRYLKGTLVVPDCAFTCKTADNAAPKKLDFGVCSPGLVCKLHAEPTWAVPFSPHCGIKFEVGVGEILQEQADNLYSPLPIPSCQGPLQYTWEACSNYVQDIPPDLTSFDNDLHNLLTIQRTPGSTQAGDNDLWLSVGLLLSEARVFTMPPPWRPGMDFLV